MANIIQQFKNANGDNIYPIAYAQGGCKMDLLWTNPSPTSDFAAQTISLDLSGYDNIGISFKAYTTSEKYSILYIFSKNSLPTISPTFSDNGYLKNRTVTIGSSGVTFSTGYVLAPGTSVETSSASECLPYQIYGIKISYIVPTNVQGLQYVEVE